MKKNIFIKVLGIALILIFLLFTSSALILYNSGQNSIKKRIIIEANLLSSIISADNYSNFSNIKDFEDTRITIISYSEENRGEVLFDSYTTQELENHLDRPEVVAAIENNPTVYERYSSSLDCRIADPPSAHFPYKPCKAEKR
jgi:hypothetical protein